MLIHTRTGVPFFILNQSYSELIYGEEDYLETTGIDLNLQEEQTNSNEDSQQQENDASTMNSGIELEVVVVADNAICGNEQFNESEV